MALVGVKQLSLSFAIFGCSSNPRMPAISLNNFPSSSSTYSPFQFQNIQVLKNRNPKWFTSRIHCSANSGPITEKNAIVKERSVSVILLAGGKGKRMGADMPKQYLPLLGQPIALYSLYTFSQMVEVKEIVVVCDPSYKDIFEDTKNKIHVDLRFTEPGKERQDSVYSGLQAIDSDAELVCIHDSARPLVYSQDVEKVLKDGWLHGAAVLGVPVKATIKEASNKSFVVKTLDRKTLWEMQTPQVIKPALLKEGFDLVNRKGLEVTDDVSIVEHLGHPVFITEGSYTNIKTPKHKGECRSCYSHSIYDTLRRKGGNLLRGSQKDNHKQPGSLSRSKKQKIHSQMVKGGGESSFGTVNSDDELSTNFGELNLEGLSRLDGRRWSASYRSQNSSDFIAASGEGEEESSSENIRSLSQRYRPIFFDELIGKNIVVQSLMNSISKGRVAPIYLFPGPRGTGKTSSAKIFAAALNCLALKEQNPVESEGFVLILSLAGVRI